jgi:hypothetical protein
LELQDPDLASTMRVQQQRALEFWEKNWVERKLSMLKLLVLYIAYHLVFVLSKLC